VRFHRLRWRGHSAGRVSTHSRKGKCPPLWTGSKGTARTAAREPFRSYYLILRLRAGLQLLSSTRAVGYGFNVNSGGENRADTDF